MLVELLPCIAKLGDLRNDVGLLVRVLGLKAKHSLLIGLTALVIFICLHLNLVSRCIVVRILLLFQTEFPKLIFKLLVDPPGPLFAEQLLLAWPLVALAALLFLVLLLVGLWLLLLLLASEEHLLVLSAHFECVFECALVDVFQSGELGAFLASLKWPRRELRAWNWRGADCLGGVRQRGLMINTLANQRLGLLVETLRLELMLGYH